MTSQLTDPANERPLPERPPTEPPASPVSGSAIACSVGIMAYNEEANIAQAIATILGQTPARSCVAELIVVASGCDDRTCPIVAELAQGDSRVRLIEQERREGKASAINLFIKAAQSPVLLMVSADVLVKEGTIDALLAHFEDPRVGMVGGHPIPVNPEGTFLGHAVHLQWRLHDRIARHSPKLGEIVAFRNVVPSIPLDTAVDEISIQALITQVGYELVYEPQAVVYNRGPETIGDFLRQRRRIYAGHVRVREQQAYSASTMSGRRVSKELLGSGSFANPRAAMWSLGTVGLEVAARALGRYDVVRQRPQHVWEVCATTKHQIAEGASSQTQENVLVFHIVDFHRWQLELGVHATRQLTRRVRSHIRRALGTQAVVSIERGGTIVALLPGVREEAERAARRIVQDFETTPLPLNGHGPTSIRLGCGMLAVPEAGSPVDGSMPVPLPSPDPAVSPVG